MKLRGSILMMTQLIIIHYLTVLPVSQAFDFFYFVQQWPGSYCDTEKACCYPTTGKPSADFGIHGLWPNNKDGSYPSDCDPHSPYDPSSVSDLLSSMQKSWPTLACPSNDGTGFWAHEWAKHGTCTEPFFDQHDYFQTTLDLKNKADLLKLLEGAGIRADGGSYSVESVKSAIKRGLGVDPWIECNVGASGKSQVYQVYLCVDTSGKELIECPVLPKGRGCGPDVDFPTF